MDNTTVQLSKNFKAWVVTHGRYGDTFEQILIRLIGEDMYRPSGDRKSETYSKDDVDSKKTKKKRMILPKTTLSGREGK